jgi:hypothetical protein
MTKSLKGRVEKLEGQRNDTALYFFSGPPEETAKKEEQAFRDSTAKLTIVYTTSIVHTLEKKNS